MTGRGRTAASGRSAASRSARPSITEAQPATPGAPAPWLVEMADRPVHAAWKRIVCETELPTDATERAALLDVVQEIGNGIEQMHRRIVNWDESANVWITNFHLHLDSYDRVYATDYDSRSSVGSPHFETYLREQYEARLQQLKGSPKRQLIFSALVHDAIRRTDWTPMPTMWKNYRMTSPSNHSKDQLEIVRILIRPLSKRDDLNDLQNLDFDHRQFAIPLFVLDPEHLSEFERADFVIGFGKSGTPIKCYRFDDAKGHVREVGDGQALTHASIFESLLKNRNLKTVDQVIGHRVLIRNNRDMKDFATGYDRTRKASDTILDVLRDHLKPDLTKVGLDLGCGTGNYTLPFVGHFKRLIGLDIVGEMLEVAKKKPKADQVDWIQADATTTTLEDQSCDAVWLISTLHYFRGERQHLLFEEIYRVLKDGGTMVADTEFAEQHKSLWVVEYFPSLRERYKGACLNSDVYKKWLAEIGFHNVTLLNRPWPSNEPDKFLRIGQRDPRVYLNATIRAGIPAFVAMSAKELNSGLEKLEEAINKNKIQEVIARYEANAKSCGDRGQGDLGIIVATR